MQTPVHNDKVIPLNRASSDAVQNLAKLALVDDVTGLYNRRFLFNYLDRIVGNHETSTCLSLAIIDIDFFKAVNDNYGHLCGDSVLASFAAFLKNHLRKDDIAVRYAGDEFVLLLPDTSLETAAVIMKRLCAETAEHSFASDLPGRKIRITFSAGFECLAPGAGVNSGKELLRKADAALYVAKRRGRNQVCSACDISSRPKSLLNFGDAFHSNVIIGRSYALNQMRTQLDSAKEGRGWFTLLSGEIGVGKSRCANYLQEVAVKEGFTILAGSCHDYTASMPYWAVTDLLRDSLLASGKKNNLEKLAGFVPSLVSLLPEVENLAAGGLLITKNLMPQERNVLFSGICRYLSSLAEKTPLLIRIEDAQWIDQSSAQFLAFYARQIADKPVQVLCTYSPEEVLTTPDSEHPLMQLKNALAREANYSHIHLERLQQFEVASMISQILSADSVSDKFTDYIYRESEGNPFFIEQILRTLYDEGNIYPVDDGWERERIENLILPPSIRDLFRRRISRVNDQTREVLSQAAIIGEVFEFDILRQVSGLNEGYLLDVLDEAIAAQLVEEYSKDGERYRFTHGKIMQVLYEEMTMRRRKMLHSRVAELLEQLDRSQDLYGRLSWHFYNSGHAEKACTYSLLAAQRAVDLLAFDEALSQLKTVEELMADEIAISDEQHLLYLLISGRALFETGKYQQALSNLEKARKLAEAEDDRLSIINALILKAMCEERFGEYDAAYLSLTEARDYAKREDVDPTVFARIYRIYGVIHLQKGELRQALEYALKQLEKAKAAQSVYDERLALLLLGSIYFEWDVHERAEQYFEEGLRLAPEDGDSLEPHFINNLGILAFNRGDWDEADSLYHRGLVISRRLGDMYQQTILLINRCELQICRGQVDEAEKNLQTIAQLVTEMKSKDLTGHLKLNEGLLNIRKEKYQEALNAFDTALSSFSEIEAKYSSAVAYAYRALALVLLGRFEEALQSIQQSEKLSKEADNKSNLAMVVGISAFASYRLCKLQDAYRKIIECKRYYKRARRPFHEAMLSTLEALVMLKSGADRRIAFRRLDKAAAVFEQLGTVDLELINDIKNAWKNRVN